MILSEDQQSLFIETLYRLRTNINLPEVSKSCGFSFFNDIKPTYDAYPLFYTEIKNFLLSYKYSLISKLNSKSGKGALPVTNIKSIIEFIDDGTLLPPPSKETVDKPKMFLTTDMKEDLGLEPRKEKPQFLNATSHPTGQPKTGKSGRPKAPIISEPIFGDDTDEDESSF